MDKDKKYDAVMAYRGFIILLLITLIAVSNNSARQKERADYYISEFKSELHQKDKEIQQLQQKVDNLEYYQELHRSRIIDIIDYLGMY